MKSKFCVLCLAFLFACTVGHGEKHPVDSRSKESRGSLIKEPEQSGALLLSSFISLQDFKDSVRLEYSSDPAQRDARGSSSGVRLFHRYKSNTVVSELIPGISEKDFIRARDGGLWDKARIVIRSPYAVMNHKKLTSIEILGRRRNRMFGEGDIAFYDIALGMVGQILPEDTLRLTREEMGEKGYLNTFNHVAAQAFMTSIYSERIADMVADVHERHTMPELMTGIFTEEQLNDMAFGPVDNYVDMINNEWGQEIGKVLKEKYNLDESVEWNTVLLASYLNDLMRFQSRVFQIGFKPFKPEDEMVIRFTEKLNTVLMEVSRLRAEFY